MELKKENCFCMMLIDEVPPILTKKVYKKYVLKNKLIRRHIDANTNREKKEIRIPFFFEINKNTYVQVTNKLNTKYGLVKYARMLNMAEIYKLL
jgi:hypothetical protein